MISEQKFTISVTKYVPLAINYTIKDLVRFNNGDVRSSTRSLLQVQSFGDPVDMLYSELITEHLNAVANSFGPGFVPQGDTNLPTLQFLLITIKTIWI